MNYKDGKFDGPFIEWYENGNKKLEVTYSSSQKNGTESLWDKNGQLIETMIWREGVLVELRGDLRQADDAGGEGKPVSTPAA